MDDRQKRLVRDHLVVALDVETRERSVRIVEKLGDRVDHYKVSPPLFTRHGPAYFEDLLAAGATDLFLDLKFHDIPNTVEASVAEVAEHPGVSMLTVHASGGTEMVRSACDAAAAGDLDVVAVTALTSLSANEVRGLTGGLEVDTWADRLATLAVEAGVDGLVSSAREVGDLRDRFGDDLLLVTPGIRPEWAASDDQERVVTPAEALSAGSDRLVIGRPVHQADDPAEAVERIGRSLPSHP